MYVQCVTIYPYVPQHIVSWSFLSKTQKIKQFFSVMKQFTAKIETLDCICQLNLDVLIGAFALLKKILLRYKVKSRTVT